MQTQTKILLLQNEQSLAFKLNNFLGLEGYIVACKSNYAEGIALLFEQEFDICILDTSLGDLCDFEMLKEIRAISQLPLILLSENNERTTRIAAFELGADDYLEKPINLRELLARIKANLRRSNITQQQYNINDLTIGPLSLRRQSREVYFKQTPVSLTDTEYCVLELITTNCGKVVSKEQISQCVYKRSLEKYDRSIDMHLSNLRKKMNMSGCQELIKTIRGSGYMMMVP